MQRRYFQLFTIAALSGILMACSTPPATPPATPPMSKMIIGVQIAKPNETRAAVESNAALSATDKAAQLDRIALRLQIFKKSL